MKLPDDILLPTVSFSSMAEAKAYRFRMTSSGWAICTINDTTGEFHVFSDWGAWSYHWNTQHLGSPTLTDFLANRDVGHCDYLASKLSSRDDIECFCPRKTVRRYRERIIDLRKENQISKDMAREIYDDLERLAGTDDVRDFIEEWSDIDGHEQVWKYSPWEHICYEPTTRFFVLRDAILPALIRHLNEQLRANFHAPMGVAHG